jgi:Virus neck protein
MAINPYLGDDTGAQDLVESVVIEIIQGTGRDIVYVPRQYANLDKIFGEDPGSKFTASYTIEAYVDTYKGFNGKDLVNQFGIEVKDQIELTMAKKRFEQEVTANDATLTRPREGDLIYFPLSKSLFEINFVEHENPFYALGKRYSYYLTCELFTYSMEKISTGNTAIDQVYDTSYRTFYDLAISSHSGGTFHQGQYIRQSGGCGGFGQIVFWDSKQNLLTIDITGGTFSSAYPVYAIGDTAGVYPGTTGNFTVIVPNSNRYMSYYPTKTLKGNNEDFEQERFAKNVVPYDGTDPFSEGKF